MEFVELRLIGDEAVKLLFGQVDDLGHLGKDLLRVGIAWSDALLLCELSR